VDGPRLPVTTLEREELSAQLLEQLLIQAIAQTKLLARMVTILEPLTGLAKLASLRARIGK
jgi:hypothetical protein